MIVTPSVSFGRRNPHCSNCGDLRGGPFGHETSECRYRHGMTGKEVLDLQPEHLSREWWDAAIDEYFARELGEATDAAS